MGGGEAIGESREIVNLLVVCAKPRYPAVVINLLVSGLLVAVFLSLSLLLRFIRIQCSLVL